MVNLNVGDKARQEMMDKWNNSIGYFACVMTTAISSAGADRKFLQGMEVPGKTGMLKNACNFVCGLKTNTIKMIELLEAMERLVQQTKAN